MFMLILLIAVLSVVNMSMTAALMAKFTEPTILEDEDE
jgi:hypothetical protein